MVQAIAICSSIEAEKIGLKTRRFSPSRPIFVTGTEGTRERRYPFSLDRNSSAWIEKEYISQGGVVFKSSMLVKGDEIQGYSIDGWARKPLGRPYVQPGSHTHFASFLTIEGGCYAHIEKPKHEHLDNPEMAEKVAPINQIKRVISN